MMRRSPSMVLGAEYDGAVLRLVRMHGGRVTNFQTFSATTTEAAAVIRSQMDRHTRCVVAWGAAGATVRRTRVPNVPVRQLPIAARELLNRQLPGAAEQPGAGMVISGDDATAALAAVGAITAEAADDLRHELASTRSSLVVAPFTLRHDGLYLAIRNSGSELVLVHGGIAVAARHLRSGGLNPAGGTDKVGERLTSPDTDPHDTDPHALATVASGDLSNTESVAAARRYVATLVREVRRTTDHWESTGEVCPSTIWVYGPGATLPHLPSYLSSVGLTAQAAPVTGDLQLDAIPTAQRLAAYGALSAAVAASGSQPMLDLSRATTPRGIRTTDLHNGDPFAGFEGVINASGTRGFSSPRTSYRRPEPLPRGTGLAFVVGVIALGLAVTGWWLSANSLEEADRTLAAAQRVAESRQAQAAYLTEVGIVAERLGALEIAEPTDWSLVIQPLLVYLPAAPDPEWIRVVEIGDSLEARIATRSDATNLEDWTEALALAGTVVSVGELADTTGSTPGVALTEFVVQMFSPEAVLIDTDAQGSAP